MHELGLCEDILRAVLKRGAGRRVRAARVIVGGHPVDPEVIRTNVQVAAAGTLAEGLAVDVVSRPTGMRCRACGHVADPADAMSLVACRACGGLDIAADDDAEHEVVLESITVDSPTAPPPHHAPVEPPGLVLAGPLAAADPIRDRIPGRPSR